MWRNLFYFIVVLYLSMLVFIGLKKNLELIEQLNYYQGLEAEVGARLESEGNLRIQVLYFQEQLEKCNFIIRELENAK